MSYGRRPYYIIRAGIDEEFIEFFIKPSNSDTVRVPYDAMAQFVASLANRGDDELNEFIERGKELRPNISRDLGVTVENAGWIQPD